MRWLASSALVGLLIVVLIPLVWWDDPDERGRVSSKSGQVKRDDAGQDGGGALNLAETTITART